MIEQLPWLAPRATDSHKGTFGRALLLGGSRGMSGAIAMAGMACGRIGAGLVRLAVPDSCLETVAGYSPCLMICPVTCQDASGRMCGLTDLLLEQCSACDCLAIGPGWGRSPALEKMLADLLAWMSQHAASTPIVIDADGLNALAVDPNWPKLCANPLVITPHPGEWARLSGKSASDPELQAEAAKVFARQFNITIVLKGARSWVMSGDQSWRNVSGTPAMATGGSGDVLTGVIVGLICQGLEPYAAARLGTYLHGLAGQLAEKHLGAHVVLPTELIDFLPSAIQHHNAMMQV